MRRRLRVLVLSRAYPNAALPTLGPWVEQPTVRLAERFDVRVVSPVPWCPPLAGRRLRHYTRFRGIPAVERREGVEVLHPRFLAGPGTSLYALEGRAYAAGIRRTVERLRDEFPFDLVHAHFIYPDGAVAHRLARRYRVPFVVTEHAPWHGWVGRLGVAREALPAARAAAAIMAVSASVRKSVLANAPDARVEVIPVGVDTARFAPLAPAQRRRDRILFVGFVNFNKGVDVLLDALAAMAARGVSAQLVLAGGAHYRNTMRQEAHLRRYADSLRLGERVRFVGKIPQEDVARLMAESAVVVLPSRAESFGAVLVEALACGTPVVATRCGGPEDIVTSDVGELVPVGDPQALAAALARVLESQDRYDPERLRAFATERFAWEAVVERIAGVYAQAA